MTNQPGRGSFVKATQEIVVSRDGNPAFTIPVGTTGTVSEPGANPSQVEVIWNGEVWNIFTARKFKPFVAPVPISNIELEEAL